MNRALDFLGGLALLLSFALAGAGALFVLGLGVRALPSGGALEGIGWLVAGLGSVVFAWAFARWVILRLNRRIR